MGDREAEIWRSQNCFPILPPRDWAGLPRGHKSGNHLLRSPAAGLQTLASSPSRNPLLPTPSCRLPRSPALPPKPTRAAKRRRDPGSVLQVGGRAHAAPHTTQPALKPCGGPGHSAGGPRTPGPRGRLRQKARESREAALPSHPRGPAAPSSPRLPRRPAAALALARLALGRPPPPSLPYLALAPPGPVPDTHLRWAHCRLPAPRGVHTGETRQKGPWFGGGRMDGT